MTDSELIDRAIRAYFRRYGQQADMPSTIHSTVSTRGVVRLVNACGLLATYRYDARADRLSFVA